MKLPGESTIVLEPNAANPTQHKARVVHGDAADAISGEGLVDLLKRGVNVRPGVGVVFGKDLHQQRGALAYGVLVIRSEVYDLHERSSSTRQLAVLNSPLNSLVETQAIRGAAGGVQNAAALNADVPLGERLEGLHKQRTLSLDALLLG